MKISKESHDFLSGEKFSDSYYFQLTDKNETFFDRLTWFEEQVRGKSVLDVGCVDHNAALIESKRNAGIWLHDRLRRAAAHCLGIDTSVEGIDYLKNVLGFKDLICGDLFLYADEILKKDFEIIVLGEILEHIDNPVDFLGRIKQIYGKRIKKVLISVPNALRFENFKCALSHREGINSDHRYWFTPYTLAKVCIRAGWNVEGIYMGVDRMPSKKGIRNYLTHSLLERYPLLRNTVLASIGLDS